MIDLHTHSTASDGALSPEKLIKTASEFGLQVLALTDHDTIDGLEEARKEAESRGIGFIPGIELEIEWVKAPAPNTPVGEFHLLGLGVSSPSPGFLRGVADLARFRVERNQEILDRGHEIGIELDYQELLRLAAEHSGEGGEGKPRERTTRSIGRPHIASLLIQRGLVKTREEAFEKYLRSGKPMHVPKRGLNFEQAQEMIHESQGLAVLAHPMSLYISWGSLPDLVKKLMSQGLDGIEAWHPTAKVQACKRLEELGKSLGLLVTAGSDFHGPSRPDRNLGFTAGNRRIEDSYLPPRFR